jgi:Domain of unknown function (DUF5615)
VLNFSLVRSVRKWRSNSIWTSTFATITAGLRRRNIDALTSQEDGTREVDDVSLLQRATELGRVLFSQDQDLLQIASEWQRTEHSFLGLVFSAQQGVSIGQCVEDLELLAL